MTRVLLALALAGCVDTTGSALVTFHAAAAGPGGPLETDVNGTHVTLTAATLHIGALYLRLTQPSAGAQATPCILPGPSYNGEVRAGRDVDLLSGEPQLFPDDGRGTADTSAIAEVWLTGGPIDADNDTTAVLALAGTATKGDARVPFTGSVHIGGNRALPGSDPAQPGAHPICKQRIVTSIPAGFAPSEGGTLLVRVDPLGWFANVDFATLPADDAHPGSFIFPDSNDDQNSKNLFNAVHASAAYTVTFTP